MLERDEDFALLQIAAFAGSEKAFASAVEPQIGKLPRQAGLAVDGVLKTGARQYWLFGKHADVPAGLGAATNLSQSRVRLTLEGPDAWKRLMAVSPVDFDPAIFRLNAFAMTGMHHTPVLIWRTGETRYAVFALRTLAQSMAEWLES
jgi:methylglutamate dehydrogenase subunit D